MTIILGIMIAVSPWNVGSGNETLVQAFGVATIAFGSFRLITYHKRLQRLKRQEHEEEDNDDDNEQTEEKS